MEEAAFSLIAIQVGRPRTYTETAVKDDAPKSWTTAFVKETVHGPVRLSATNLEGDEQADKVNHGGPDKAVLAYTSAHYAVWQSEYPDVVFPFGAFGENLTIQGITEEDVAIGDVYAIGDTLLQVAQPRIPCWKVSRRFGVNGITERVRETGRTGWYLRVLREGTVEAGMPITRTDRPHPELTIRVANDLLTGRSKDEQLVHAFLACDELAAVWKDILGHLK